jgi:hypothetical protein
MKLIMSSHSKCEVLELLSIFLSERALLLSLLLLLLLLLL